MRPRSRKVALCIMGASGFALAGCQQEQVEAQAYPDLASCEAAAERDGLLSQGECADAFADAQALHVESAPRYENLEVCEAEHGEGACGSEAEVAEGGSGGIFMPLLAGYLIGNMMGGRGMAAAQPLYRTPDGRFTNASRGSVYSSNSGRTQLAPSQFARPAATAGQPPMTQATANSRGGFGSTGGARSFGG